MVFIAGFTLSLSLILAIGSQNAFVLKQGIQQQSVLLICSICALSDAILISLGVAGFGVIVNEYPVIEEYARYGGAGFLFVYSALSFKSSFSQNHALIPEEKLQNSTLKTVAICLAFTWLNPHVYLDTMVLLGSISTQYEGEQLQFALGAILGSFIFFFSLGYGARLLAPIFQSPKAWKVLEFIVGLTMLFIALLLVSG
ncbi:LysE/ArgO family amino acid transporter [Oceanicoccus sagamiensis]|uniref:Amino acid transporter n=1 Tax=Oceanicoccus sagamiensis TaxID=716816 RepID=A0A1X9N9I4_9GAMM|nr:LysE/ArgO family amino acid transporter [Oceanicoccus sagamiensis]ARN73841.1 amino acid transporter [Oceanicoccus sagamiensis]